MKISSLKLFLLCIILPVLVNAQNASLTEHSAVNSIFLRSQQTYKGTSKWQIQKVSALTENDAEISKPGYQTKGWLPATVPGTVLNSLIANKIYPEPYYGDQNRKERKLIPDIADAGIEFYHYWFRTDFELPKSFAGKRVWLKFHGINYRSEIWVNGKHIGTMAGMFHAQEFDITDIVSFSGKNAVALKVKPVDVPGTSNKFKKERPGAFGENGNGGDGEMGKNVSMLMSVGWDFTAPDGIRDRNTGVWRDVELFATNAILLDHAFVQTKLPLPDTTSAKETISVETFNATDKVQQAIVSAKIEGLGKTIRQTIVLKPRERKTVTFLPENYPELILKNPKLWWPLNKGKQHLYTLKLAVSVDGIVSHELTTRFGIREITSDQQTPDQSRRFLVNGYPVFIRGSNWVPEAMLRNTEQRTYAELRYTKQAGINFLRLWGGGIAESDYFYQLCDEMGIMVWSEFWITGDTRFPTDTALYFKNLTSTIKRIRNHASSAYYVSANESAELPGAGKLIYALDPTKGYQSQSECCGIHDGSPYKYENPMQYFENTASKRGSRVDGFNPEYGTPILPILSSLKKLMPERDLWPINKPVWDYLDGGGFHQMTTKYHEAVEQFGKSETIEDYAKKAQFVGAMNFRALWEVWNYNKFSFGDRFSSGLLFWYHNSPLPQTASRFYDWFLEPTAGLYYAQNGLQPLHPQYDYLKNTVSIANDYRQAFKGYQLLVKVYDFNSKEVLALNSSVNIPADGTAKDVLKIDFPEQITQIHFIKLVLLDHAGKQVSESFYWRSKDAYKGAWTMTGPATSGFQDMGKLSPSKLDFQVTKVKSSNELILNVRIKNIGQSISFFTQLKLNDEHGYGIMPAFYTDNFFNLLPGEVKQVRIEIPHESLKGKKIKLFLDAYNVSELMKEFQIETN
ncbi:glycoside hydrolase family 2 protein [Pedobacter sp. MC2016-24]|uniref:beta-mannosidase n=1 Tax=Pedobacter sp. MC2016-24 TaxID=2780090 RepID=UPI0018821F21|nr:sugar-binding domain-containing protein [Pedobacter sp. MC2016-24]MBE9601724.1 glycoside hydrolase family 2 [Pedobacter sp. MC2016-24]